MKKFVPYEKLSQKENRPESPQQLERYGSCDAPASPLLRLQPKQGKPPMENRGTQPGHRRFCCLLRLNRQQESDTMNPKEG